MAKLAVSELTTFRWTFDEDVNAYRSSGFDGVGVWRQKLSDFGEEKGNELLCELGLKVSSLSWAGGFTGSDGQSFRDGLEDAMDAVRLASILSADCLVIHSGARAGHTHNHARRLLRNALSELLPIAEEHELTLTVEPMHKGCTGDWTFLTNLQETLDFIDSFQSPRLKLVFDTYHMADHSVLELLSDLVPKIALVQFGDCRESPRGDPNRCRLGDGIVPLREIVQALKLANYQGFIEVELMGEEFENCDYTDLLHKSKNFLTSVLETTVLK